MPLKVKLGNGNTHPLSWKLMRAGLSLVLIFGVIGASVFGYYYLKYRGLVAERLAQGPLFAASAQI